MKKLFFALLIFSASFAFGQSNFRRTMILNIPNDSTVFHEGVPVGTIIIDTSNRNEYYVLRALSATKEIRTCIVGSDIYLENSSNGFLTSELDPIWISDSATYAAKSWVLAKNYLTSYTETDPIYSAWDKSTGISILHSQISDWATATNGFLTSELDPIWISDSATYAAKSWVLAKNYLTSYTETDPVFVVSQAHNITTTDITNLSHLSGTNTGDQNITGIQINSDSITKLRSSINNTALNEVERFSSIQGQTKFAISHNLTINNLIFVNGALEDISQYTGIGTDTVTFNTPLSLYDKIVVFYQVGANTANQIYWYGVEWDTTVSDPAVTRIGNLSYASALPIQNGMVRADVNDNGTINYYLDPHDSNKKADGTTADLTGASGQVMVIIPTHWYRFEKIGTKRRIEIATVALSGFTKVPSYAVGAYDAYYNSTTGKLESRSGVMPTTNITRASFRTYAAARGTGWHEFSYTDYKDIFYLYLTEYATFDIQSVIPGATNANSTDWSNYNGYNPVVTNGVSNTYGNYSASVPFSLANFVGGTGTLNSQVADYRGIENIYGHIWQFIDGVNVNYVSTTQANVYTDADPSTFADDTQTGYTLLGTAPNASGWIRSLIDGSWLPATDVGASSSTYMTDYHYVSSVQTGVWRVVLAGGNFSDASIAGLLDSFFYYASSSVYPFIGGRLCLKIE